jgi:hypothetical protein
MIMLPSDNILLAESPCPESVFTATPDIVVLLSGRYITLSAHDPTLNPSET